MIPKVIHCCWFSGESKPPLARRCLASWRKFAPDFEIREWDVEALRQTLGALPAFAEAALKARKWAFASDWARFAVVGRFGGVYLDLDVELIAPLAAATAAGGFFAAAQDDWVDPGLGFAAEAGDVVIAEIVKRYETMEFNSACHLSQSCPEVVNPIVRGRVRVLPPEVFNPKGGCSGRIRLTEKTIGIHHYAASWFNWKQRLAYRIMPRLGLGGLLPWLRAHCSRSGRGQ